MGNAQVKKLHVPYKRQHGVGSWKPFSQRQLEILLVVATVVEVAAVIAAP
jgi:hypothetical protein